MNISIEQLEHLLNQQKHNCRKNFEEAWRSSEMVEDMLKTDPNREIINKIHLVWDAILCAELPNDVEVLKNYL